MKASPATLEIGVQQLLESLGSRRIAIVLDAQDANFYQNKTSSNILIVSDDMTFVVTLSEALNIRLPQLNIVSCTSITAAIGLCRTGNYDVVVSDFKKLKTKGRELLTLLGGKAPQTPLLVICKIQD